MYKKIFIITFFLFLLIPVISFSADNKTENKLISTVEIRGVISSRKAYVRKKPDSKSKIIRTLWRNSKVVVIGIEGDWLKIKVNNVRNGYLLKKHVAFKNTFKKESKRSPYLLRKVNIDIKSLIGRFNLNMTESVYFEKEGIVPTFEFKKVYKKDNRLITEIIYTKKTTAKKIKGEKNPFSHMIKSFIEVIFFKMMLFKADEYIIKISYYDIEKNKKVLRDYTTLIYNTKSAKFDDLKNNNGKIWQYTKSTKPIKELFLLYP